MMELDANWVCDTDSREVLMTYFFYLYIGLWIFSGYLVTRRINRNDSLMGNLGPVIFFGFIIFFASFELLEWISSEICQTTGNWWWWPLKTRIDSYGIKGNGLLGIKGGFLVDHNYKISFKKHMLPFASRKRVDVADAFNDLPVIHVFGQQRFAMGGLSGADNQRIPERKLMKRRNVHHPQDTLCSHLHDFEDRELHQQHSGLL